MNKKLLGIKISSILTAVLCTAAAFVTWLLVNVSAL